MSRTARNIGTLTLMGMALALGANEAQAQGLQFNSLTPCRVFDTRCPNNAATCGALTNPPKPNPGPYLFRIQGACGVPNGARAATLNVTVVGPTHAGNLSIYPANLSKPVVSTINFVAGEQGLANGAIVPLAQVSGACTQGTGGAGCDLAIYLDMAVVAPGGNMQFLVDVTGYFQ